MERLGNIRGRELYHDRFPISRGISTVRWFSARAIVCEGMDMIKNFANEAGVIQLKMKKLFVVGDRRDEIIGLELGTREFSIRNR